MLYQRRCWTPPRNTNETSYCEWFAKNTDPNIGEIMECKTCYANVCNIDIASTA